MADAMPTYYEQQVQAIHNQRGVPEYYYIQVKQAKFFMEQYHNEKIGLGKIAASASMSRFHFIRVFRLVYGITPHQYLKNIRITKAKELLIKNVPVNQVCTNVGYESLPTFSNIFKKGTGYGPDLYRKMNKAI